MVYTYHSMMTMMSSMVPIVMIDLEVPTSLIPTRVSDVRLEDSNDDHRDYTRKEHKEHIEKKEEIDKCTGVS